MTPRATAMAAVGAAIGTGLVVLGAADALLANRTRTAEAVEKNDELRRAIEATDLAAVKTACATGASLDAALTDDGSTPLHLVASDGKLELVVWMLSEGAKIDARRRSDGCTALSLALRSDRSGAPSVKDVISLLSFARAESGGELLEYYRLYISNTGTRSEDADDHFSLCSPWSWFWLT